MTIKEYLNQDQKIGFTESFPAKKQLYSETYVIEWRNRDIKVSAHLVQLTFGEKEEFNCFGVETSSVDISKYLPMNGWGSMCFTDEAKIMRDAVVDFCEKHNLVICAHINDWPTANVVVTNFKNQYPKC